MLVVGEWVGLVRVARNSKLAKLVLFSSQAKAKAAGMGRGGGMGNPVNVGIAVQADWENREFISNISLNVRRLFDFLLRFGQLDRSAPPFYIHFPLLASIGSAAAFLFHTMPSRDCLAFLF